MILVKRVLKPYTSVLFYWAVIIACTGLFSCSLQDFIQEEPQTEINSGLYTGGSGEETETVELTLGCGNVAGARTVFADAPEDIASFELLGHPGYNNDDLVSMGSWTIAEWTNNAKVAVTPGTWTFYLDAFNAAGKLVLEGYTGLDVQESRNLLFELQPLENLTGEMELILKWPKTSDVNSVSLYTSGLVSGSSPGSLPTDLLKTYGSDLWTDNGDTYSVTYSDPALASGNYVMAFRLYNANGIKCGSVTELVHIRDYLESDAVLVLKENDINSRINGLPSDLTVTRIPDLTDWEYTSAVVSWTDNCQNEDYYKLQYLDDADNEWKTEYTKNSEGFSVLCQFPPDTTSCTVKNYRGDGEILYRVGVYNSFEGGNNYIYPETAVFDTDYHIFTYKSEISSIDDKYIEVADDSEFTLDSGFSLEGCTLTGWSVTEDDTIEHADGAAFTMPSSNYSLHAVWAATSYTISYVLNDGTNTANPPATYTAVADVTLPEPTRSGYTFGGWYTDSGFADSTYLDCITTGTLTGDITLYALWAESGTPQSGSITCTVEMKEEGTLTFTGPATVNKGTDIIINVDSGFDDYFWWLDTERINITTAASEITISTDELTIGVHTVTVVVGRSDEDYSAEYRFTVK